MQFQVETVQLYQSRVLFDAVVVSGSCWCKRTEEGAREAEVMSEVAVLALVGSKQQPPTRCCARASRLPH